MSRRTLQRRLAEEGGDSSAILNEIRREQSVRHPSNARLRLHEAAGLVGYDCQMSFGRWFAGKFGMVPPWPTRTQRLLS